jgi:hypothetical protein
MAKAMSKKDILLAFQCIGFRLPATVKKPADPTYISAARCGGRVKQ